MNEGQDNRLGFFRPEVHEGRETAKTNTIKDALKVVQSELRRRCRELSPDFDEDGRLIAENFCEEFLCLLQPAAEMVHLNGSQSVFVEEALFKAWSFKGYPGVSPTVDQNKVLGVATYLNSLVSPERG